MCDKLFGNVLHARICNIRIKLVNLNLTLYKCIRSEKTKIATKSIRAFHEIMRFSRKHLYWG